MNYRAAASTNLIVLAFGPNVVGMNPATGQRIVVGGGGEVACFEAGTGAPRWHDKFPGMGIGAVALATPGRAVQADLRH
jgi:hypothetical protein